MEIIRSSSAGDSKKFEITDAKLHVPIVTLFTKDSVDLTKELSEGLKRSVYWNNYQTKPAIVIEKGTNIYKLLNTSFCSCLCCWCRCYNW